MVAGRVRQVVAHGRYILTTNRPCQKNWSYMTGGRKKRGRKTQVLLYNKIKINLKDNMEKDRFRKGQVSILLDNNMDGFFLMPDPHFHLFPNKSLFQHQNFPSLHFWHRMGTVTYSRITTISAVLKCCRVHYAKDKNVFPFATENIP